MGSPLSYQCTSYLEQRNNIPEDLVSRAGQGDGDAQAWLYQQYSKAMFNICIRMTGNRANAEDVLQDAFLLAFKNLRQLKEPVNFGGWLRRIVVNESIRYAKRSFNWKELEDEYPDSLDDDATSWCANISLDLIHQEIKNLPEGYRQVFVLYVLEDYSHGDIARSLGISESTSKSQYHRARRLLRDRITQQTSVNG